MIENLKKYNILANILGTTNEIEANNGKWVKFSELEEALRSTIPNTTKATICPVCGGERYIIGKLSYSKHECSSCNGSGKQ